MPKLSKIGKYISKRVGKAICDYSMIEGGDTILAGISGGKDSLVMLDMLVLRASYAPVRYTIHPVFVESALNKDEKLREYLENLFKDYSLSYTVLSIDVELKEGENNCFWCSWNRRKAIFDLADKLGAKKIALGHHKDDIVETILINMFFVGDFSTMNPRQELFGGKINIIRPLAYCEEKAIAEYAEEKNLMPDLKPCLYKGDSRRKMIKKFLNEMEDIFPHVKTNIYNSMARIKRDYIDLKEC